MGEHKKSQDRFEKAISLVDRDRYFPSWLNLAKIALARTKVVNNEIAINLTEIFGWRKENRVELFDGWVSRYIGEILLNIDEKHMSEAEDWIKRAIEADSRNGMMFHLAKDYAAYADLYKRKGAASKAKQTLNKAIKTFKECGADGWVERARKTLKSYSSKT